MINTDEGKIYNNYTICPKCGHSIDGNNLFCTNCGFRLEQQLESDSEIITKGNDINESGDSKTKKLSKKAKIIITVLSVLLIASVIEGIVLYRGVMHMNERYYDMRDQRDEYKQEVEKKEEALDDVEEELADVQTENKRLENEMKKYKQKSIYYGQMCSFLKSSDAGKASSKYYSEEKIVVLDINSPEYKLPIYSKYSSSKGYSIYYQCDGYNISCRWDQSDWTNKTYIYIDPQSEGISKITFTNSLNSDSFKVMVVVTD